MVKITKIFFTPFLGNISQITVTQSLDVHVGIPELALENARNSKGTKLLFCQAPVDQKNQVRTSGSKTFYTMPQNSKL